MPSGFLSVYSKCLEEGILAAYLFNVRSQQNDYMQHLISYIYDANPFGLLEGVVD